MPKERFVYNKAERSASSTTDSRSFWPWLIRSKFLPSGVPQTPLSQSSLLFYLLVFQTMMFFLLSLPKWSVNLNVSKSPAPDSVPPIIIEICASELGSILSHPSFLLSAKKPSLLIHHKAWFLSLRFDDSCVSTPTSLFRARRLLHPTSFFWPKLNSIFNFNSLSQCNWKTKAKITFLCGSSYRWINSSILPHTRHCLSILVHDSSSNVKSFDCSNRSRGWTWAALTGVGGRRVWHTNQWNHLKIVYPNWNQRLMAQMGKTTVGDRLHLCTPAPGPHCAIHFARCPWFVWIQGCAISSRHPINQPTRKHPVFVFVHPL